MVSELFSDERQNSCVLHISVIKKKQGKRKERHGSKACGGGVGFEGRLHFLFYKIKLEATCTMSYTCIVFLSIKTFLNKSKKSIKMKL